MTKAGFQKMGNSERQLFGPRTLVLTGFSANSHARFNTLLEKLELSDLSLVWATSEQLESPLDTLMGLPQGFGMGSSSDLPRAIIAGGISEKELRVLMSGCRNAGMTKTIWATLTPTSSTWRLGRLLSELSAEHKSLT